MLVKELIARLQLFPEHLEVLMSPDSETREAFRIEQVRMDIFDSSTQRLLDDDSEELPAQYIDCVVLEGEQNK